MSQTSNHYNSSLRVSIQQTKEMKIVSISTYLNYDSLYTYNQGRYIPTGVINSLENDLVNLPPLEARKNNIEVTLLSKEKETPLYLYYNNKASSRLANIQICNKDGQPLIILPCQKHSTINFVESPLLENITPINSLVKLHLVSTKESVVVQGEYLNERTQEITVRTIVIKNDGKNYEIMYHPYKTHNIKIKKEHKNLPLLALISIYGDELLTPLLKPITKSFPNHTPSY